ncbi:putative DNA-binding domain protein [Vibrio phage vB_VcaS_HC]|nr:putative DNA-binding domain protein [Vibrio phage vB_VcaS_HC]
MARRAKELTNDQQEERQEKTREQSRKWYADNKDDHNAKRRSRYESDPEYREKAKEQARLSAQKRREANPSVTGVYHRELNGVQVQVFKASEVAEEAGINVRTLKADEKAGKIPSMSFEGRHRVYTSQQKANLIAYYAGNMTADQLAANWS